MPSEFSPPPRGTARITKKQLRKTKNLILFFPTEQKVYGAFEGLGEKMSLRENQMLTCIPQKYVNIYMVRSLDNFFGKNEFLPEFKLDGTIWKKYVSQKVVFGDLVYGFRMPAGVTHTHPSDIHEITKDKRVVEKLFPQYTLSSIICKNYTEIQDNYHKIISDIKVLKPSGGSLGKGIFIGENIPDTSRFKQDDFPYLLQEFHDTSGGFYDICDGLHDFRIVILNGEIIAKILREPKQGKYISNTFQGGKIHDIFDFQLPPEILKIVNDIDNYCKKYTHRYYSIDMGRSIDGNIKIFEINGAPGYASKHMAHKFGEYVSKNILQVS